MSYKYGPVGSDLNWDAVSSLNEVCVECKAYMEEHKLTELPEDHVCEGHTRIYFEHQTVFTEPYETTLSLVDKLLEKPDGRTMYPDIVTWLIMHDTNNNTVTTFGNVPDEYFHEQYIKERNEAEAE